MPDLHKMMRRFEDGPPKPESPKAMLAKIRYMNAVFGGTVRRG